MNFVILDTNVIVSALLTNNKESPPSIILEKVYKGKIKLVYNGYIINEYIEVLKRRKFKIKNEVIESLITVIYREGVFINPLSYLGSLIDEKDRMFYETFLSVNYYGCYLITGNLKHFPKDKFILSRREYINLFIN